eukprot:gnl/MRDRNA2_/MRDRNA2_92005_c0_seq1.p1 gnl/MRDRNA2_/MRDRNA2_92005_c0~~gnl/MRDRNA2_/MRDRNA2_92005_c0_seq1.p1  ORF type:complete len:255 (+),score=94.96 gnl/MRDRNA2_/MRDRNA2_92005_c0_seq1:73-837(+)
MAMRALMAIGLVSMVNAGALFEAAPAKPATPPATPPATKTEVGVVKKEEKTQVVAAAATPAKAAADAKAAPATPAAATPPAATPAAATSAAATSAANSTAVTAAKKTDAPVGAVHAEKQLDDKMKAVEKSAESKKIDAKAKIAAVAKDIQAKAATNATAAKATATALKKTEDHHLREMSFFEIIGTWQWEFIRCIPIAVIAYSVLALAVYYPKMTEILQHWHVVRVTTNQGKDSVVMGRGVMHEKANPYGSFTL